MASAPVTPAAPAPATTSAPAAAPSTPPASSTPPSPPPAAAPVPAAVPAPDTRSLERQLQDAIRPGIEEARTAAAAPPPAAEESATDKVAREAAAAAAASVPGEEPEAAAAPETGPAAEGENEWDDEFAPDPAAVGPQDLAAKIAANPALKAAVDANPEVRDLIYANARLAAKAKPYTELFGSPEEAHAVVQGHQAYTGIRNLLGAVKRDDFGSTQNVINAMLEQDAMRDENGEILRDPQTGRIITGGNTGRFLRNSLLMRLTAIEQQAKQSGNDELLAHLDAVMESAGLRAPSSPAEGELSEELKAQRDQIQHDQQQLNADKAAKLKTDTDSFYKRVYDTIDTDLKTAVAAVLDRATGLTPFLRAKCDESIRNALGEAVRKSSGYQSELDVVERMPLGIARERAYVRLANRYMQSLLRPVALPILTEASVTLQRKAAQRVAVRAARAETARSEVHGAAPPTPPAANTSEQQLERAKAEFVQKNGRQPKLEEELALMMTPALARTA
jgi:hypothetical protein